MKLTPNQIQGFSLLDLDTLSEWFKEVVTKNVRDCMVKAAKKLG